MRFLTATTLTILILAILIGLVAAYGIRTLLDRPTPVRTPVETTVNIPMASVDLPEGRTLLLGDVALRPMTRAELEAKGWSTEILASSDQVLGRTLKKKLGRGEPFRPEDLYLQGYGPTFMDDLPEGYRAVTISVPNSRGGYASPGSYVDVIFRAAPVKGDETTPAIPDTTITLVENAKVLAVETSRPQTGSDTLGGSTSGLDLRNRQGGETAKPTTVILAATPKQANAISAVLGRGEISLAARPKGEAGFEVRPPATSLEDILGLEPPVPAPLPTPPFVTEFYRGSQRTINAFAIDQNGLTTPIRNNGNPNLPSGQ